MGNRTVLHVLAGFEDSSPVMGGVPPGYFAVPLAALICSLLAGK